ncbi:MAG: flavodoxin [Bacteroidetes bacterium]|nr:MAG: flavodoxin [Bacteroidota bacterium]
MEKVGIFFGSSTGNAEGAAEKIKDALGNAELFNVSDADASKMAEFENLIIGTSTWGVGDLQDDMEGFVGGIAGVELKGKKVALFGLGDQATYGDTFCDGVGTIFEALQGKGCDVVGFTSTDGYDFVESKAVDGGDFMGLILDEDNQGELSDGRISAWVEKIKGEFK